MSESLSSTSPTSGTSSFVLKPSFKAVGGWLSGTSVIDPAVIWAGTPAKSVASGDPTGEVTRPNDQVPPMNPVVSMVTVASRPSAATDPESVVVDRPSHCG